MSEPKERIDLYFIPPNFAEEGTVLSGRLRTRNAVETAILVFFMLKPLTMRLIPAAWLGSMIIGK